MARIKKFATDYDIYLKFRYLINGLFATLVHYVILLFNINIMKFPYVGISNLIAAALGSAVSFLGHRFFVFKKKNDPMHRQFAKFIVLYTVIALSNGALMFIWSDYLSYNYNIGFLLITGCLIVLGYFGNKKIIFK